MLTHQDLESGRAVVRDVVREELDRAAGAGLAIEAARLRRMVEAMAARIAGQSELLSRHAEQQEMQERRDTADG